MCLHPLVHNGMNYKNKHKTQKLSFLLQDAREQTHYFENWQINGNNQVFLLHLVCKPCFRVNK